ncbi:MAG: hypothetical protein Q7R93_04050 [bacterium]|nr:hypothetical protein [bacterium]
MDKSIRTLIVEAVPVLGVLSVIMVGAWFFSNPDPKPPLAVSEDGTKPAQKPVLRTGLDSDGDELPDWEESLWGTNPHSPDTDNDGTGDGIEVASGRNPAKKGPDDGAQTPLSVILQPQYVPPPKKPTRQEAGADTPLHVTPAEAGAQSESTLTVQAENPLHIFGNVVGKLIQTAAIDLSAEHAFLNSAAGPKKMNPELLQGFIKLAQKYEKLASDIAAVTVPEKATVEHASFADAYRKYAAALRAMGGTAVGSYLSAGPITAYSDATLVLARAVVAVSDLFYREGVGFSKTEPGSVFSFPR